MARCAGAGEHPSMNALMKFVSYYWHHEKEVMVEATPPRIGAYCADYSPITPEEIARPDAECEDLFKHSKPLSR